MKNKIVTLAQLDAICHNLREKGKKIAATSGCFDILHAGHVTYLEEAGQQADILILLLNSDSSIKAIKGKERPIVPQEERALVMAGLACVDYVCLFQEETPCDAIMTFCPDIWVKGGDYRGKRIPEKDIVEAYGGKIAYVSLVAGCSSTNIIKKIKGML